MIRDHFRVLVVDLGTGRGRFEAVAGRDDVAGGSGLAAHLFARHARPERPWDDPEQPLILAIGPLTGYFPLMSRDGLHLQVALPRPVRTGSPPTAPVNDGR